MKSSLFWRLKRAFATSLPFLFQLQQSMARSGGEQNILPDEQKTDLAWCWLWPVYNTGCKIQTSPYPSVSLREQFYLDYGKVVFFKVLIQTEIWLQGILRVTVSFVLSWVLIILVLFVLAGDSLFNLFDENNYNRSVCLTCVSFGLCFVPQSENLCCLWGACVY